MVMKVYYAGCGICIKFIPFIGDKHFEFEDGTYCEKCAKLFVETKRKNFKNREEKE